MYKKLIKIVAFLSIMVVCAVNIYKVLSWKDVDGIGISTFYKSEDNLMDVIFYGSSHCYCTVNQALLWDKAGIAGYNLAQSGQSFGSTYYYVEESLKTQKPKAIFVECGFIYQDSIEDENEQMQQYKSSLAMRTSKLYIENVKYQMRLTGSAESTEMLLNNILKWPIVHTRYSSLRKNDFVTQRDYSRGFGMAGNEGYKSREYDTPLATVSYTIGEMPEENKKYLDKLVTLASENDIELYLWVAPYVLSMEQQKCFNAVEEYASENDITFINFNKKGIIEDIDFSYENDLMNFGHVNFAGAEKVTNYLMQFIERDLDLQDHRGDSKYELWDKNMTAWNVKADSAELIKTNSLEEYLGQLDNENLISVISLDGFYDDGTGKVSDTLEKHGFMASGNNSGQFFVNESGKYIYSSSDLHKDWYKEIGKDDLVVNIDTYDGEELGAIAESKVYWNGIMLKGQRNAVNVYLIDKYSSEIVGMVYYTKEKNYEATTMLYN